MAGEGPPPGGQQPFEIIRSLDNQGRLVERIRGGTPEELARFAEERDRLALLTPLSIPRQAPPVPNTPAPEVPPPPPNLPSVPRDSWLDEVEPVPIHTTREPARERIINWQAFGRLWKRRAQEEREHAQTVSRHSRRNMVLSGIGGAIVGGLAVWAGGNIVNGNQYQINYNTIPPGQCRDSIPAGTIITARDYTVNGGNAQTDGPNTASIILYQHGGGKFCALSTEAHIQETGNPDPAFLEEMQIKYQDQLRIAGFPTFIIQNH